MTAEERALEAYPILFSERNGYDNTFKDRRESYIKGYDKAMQDFLEKACEWLKENSKSYVIFDEVGYRGYSSNLLIKYFKNYMQDEK